MHVQISKGYPICNKSENSIVLDFLAVAVQKSWLAFIVRKTYILVTVNFDIVSVCPKNCCLSFSLF